MAVWMLLGVAAGLGALVLTGSASVDPQAPTALDAMEQRQTVGRIVVRVGAGTSERARACVDTITRNADRELVAEAMSWASRGSQPSNSAATSASSGRLLR